MPNIWFISDTHFNHANILKFKDADDSYFRGDRFTSVDHMNDVMIDNWNSCVQPNDKIYHLGDVHFGADKDCDTILSKLNGHKRLIVGNHDKITRGSPLIKHFSKILLWWPFEGFIFSHVPLREDQMRTRKGDVMNVHGHIHQNNSPSHRHINISVEKTDYKPVNIDELRSRGS